MREILKEKLETMDLTPSQKKVIANLEEDILKYDGNHSDDYEYKDFDVSDADFGKYVFVYVSVGRKTDEGTLAEIFRTRRHLLIGPKGGIQLLNAADTRYKNYKRHTRKSDPKGYWNAVHCLTTY